MAAAVEQSLSVALEPCASSLPSTSSRAGQGYRGVFKVPSLVFDIEVSKHVVPVSRVTRPGGRSGRLGSKRASV